MDGTRSLDDAVRAGEPLINFFVRLKPEADVAAAKAAFNSLGVDIILYNGGWYNDPHLCSGQVTAEGVFRIFGLRLSRTRLPNSDSYYMWTPNASLDPMAAGLDQFVVSIGMSQPGANDDGRFYVPLFAR